METKPAIHTTELWVTVVIQIILGLDTLGAWDYLPDRFMWMNVLAHAVLGGLYVLSRGVAKSGVEADVGVPANFKLIPKRGDLMRRP